nr:hypothetical protein [Rhodospirillales bacterium]
MKETESSLCSKCGSELNPGYLLGKHNRIRWSTSSKGMTIFHGVPLIKLNKKYWSNWINWIYAPSIPAMRCEKCRLVFFNYDNEELENSRKEVITSSIIGVALIISGVLLGSMAIYFGNFQLEGMLLLRLIILFFALAILVPGVVFLKHAVTIQRPNKANNWAK